MTDVRAGKRLYIALTVCVIAAAAIFAALDGGEDTVRYHQHLEQPSEEELGERPESDGLVSHLPLVEIDTSKNGQYQTIPGRAVMDEDMNNVIGIETGDNGETEIEARIRTVEKEGRWHRLTDESDMESSMLIHVRGNSSRAFDKVNYRIKLTDEDDPLKSNDMPLLGMAKSSDWVLHGPFLDKTLIRNYMWMNISAEIMDYTPAVRFCELVVDGEYQGVYVMMETIEVSEERLDLSPYEAGRSGHELYGAYRA